MIYNFSHVSIVAKAPFTNNEIIRLYYLSADAILFSIQIIQVYYEEVL